MIAGRLNKPIVIEHTVTTQDLPDGEELSQEIKNITTRADVIYGGGGRSNENGEIVYPYDITFILWYYMDKYVSDYDTIIYRGDRYLIESREADEPSKILYLKCRKNG